MIQFRLAERNGNFVGFSVSGHAMFDEAGRDIVCAAVSSAVQLTVNGITEILHQTPDCPGNRKQHSTWSLTAKKWNQRRKVFCKPLRCTSVCCQKITQGTILITKSEV